MNKFKYEAMKTEFPALVAAIQNASVRDDSRWCENIAVKRITPELLGKTPQRYTVDGSLVGVDEGDVVFQAFSPKGTKDDWFLMECAAEYTRRSNYAHDDGGHTPGETILESIGKTSDEPDLIIWFEYGMEYENHYSTSTWRATIYKPAQSGPTMTEMIAEARRKAAEEVATEATF